MFDKIASICFALVIISLTIFCLIEFQETGCVTFDRYEFEPETGLCGTAALVSVGILMAVSGYISMVTIDIAFTKKTNKKDSLN